MSGWADLGAMMAGEGGQIYDRTFQRELTRRQQSELSLTRARIAQDQERQRGELEGVLASAGMSPEESKLLSTVLRGGFNPAHVERARTEAQKRTNIGLGLEMLQAGDRDGANQFFMAAGKPIVRSKVEGNTVIDPYAAPGSKTYPTDIGQSMIQRNQAQADSAGAMADLRTRTDPNVAKTKPAAEFPSVNIAPSTTPSVPEIPQGAKQAPDGKWYVPDPNRPGKWLLVEP